MERSNLLGCPRNRDFLKACIRKSEARRILERRTTIRSNICSTKKTRSTRKSSTGHCRRDRIAWIHTVLEFESLYFIYAQSFSFVASAIYDTGSGKA
ncbi:hypothetical protein ARMSODRAFT_179051 [Armillaria solidipes]|uniref:Uncharacterized protein n=1 Tax=Armillaria solidipes TaxID=1076256 RepID=A0A2H3BE78_9AGAR|nr:hypothetical protein ARMSODRAFT_179051 [Armillaria solidipes]